MRFSFRFVAVTTICLALTVWLLLRRGYSLPYRDDDRSTTGLGRNASRSSPSLWCPSGGTDILVVIKTGTTHTYKLPELLDTIYRCVPNLLIVSDFDEDVLGHHVYDVLEDIDTELVERFDELQFYRNMQEYRQRGENLDHLLTNDDKSKEHQLPWVLDKWKFLPMLRKSYEMHKASWYFFVEADTYVAWPYLIRWLAMRDPTEVVYWGNRNVVDDLSFAHGGSGFILSRPAMKKLARHLDSTPKEHFVDLTKNVCCGDLLLGNVLREIDIECWDTWPMIPGENPQTMDYTAGKWCYPPVAHHSVSSQQIDELWRFEQHHDRNNKRPLLHADLYKAFVAPNLVERISHWDTMLCDYRMLNSESEKLTEEERRAMESEDACRQICIDDEECKRYAWVAEKRECRLGDNFRFGRERAGCYSGFILERVNKYIEEFGTCDEPKWVTGLWTG